MAANPGGPRGALGNAPGQAVYEALRSRPTIAIPINTETASRTLYGKPCILVGWAIRETAGAAAVWDLLSGGDDTGSIAASISLAANGNSIAEPTGDGPLLQSWLRAKRTSGTIAGAVWVKA